MYGVMKRCRWGVMVGRGGYWAVLLLCSLRALRGEEREWQPDGRSVMMALPFDAHVVSVGVHVCWCVACGVLLHHLRDKAALLLLLP